MAGGSIRPATLADLGALLALEAHFPGDRLSRTSLRHFLSRGNASVRVWEEAGRVLGSAVVLYRRGFHAARLYSLVVDPAARGRGVARGLLERAEREASERGCVAMRLEVREDNAAALALYAAAGYSVVGRAADYYEDHSSALRMRKFLSPQPAPELLPMPYYAQTLDFTCGAASLMMALKFFRPQEVLGRELELQLWREATTIFMTSGHGGCSAHGLGLAALRRGLRATVYMSDDRVPFIDTVRSPEKKDVIAISHRSILAEFEALGGETRIGDFGLPELAEAIGRGGVPIVLVSGYRLYGEKLPHWVVVTGLSSDFIYLHDPFVPDGSHAADALNLPYRRADFERLSRFGRGRHRYMVVLERSAV